LFTNEFLLQNRSENGQFHIGFLTHMISLLRSTEAQGKFSFLCKILVNEEEQVLGPPIMADCNTLLGRTTPVQTLDTQF